MKQFDNEADAVFFAEEIAQREGTTYGVWLLKGVYYVESTENGPFAPIKGAKCVYSAMGW